MFLLLRDTSRGIEMVLGEGVWPESGGRRWRGEAARPTRASPSGASESAKRQDERRRASGRGRWQTELGTTALRCLGQYDLYLTERLSGPFFGDVRFQPMHQFGPVGLVRVVADHVQRGGKSFKVDCVML